METNEELAKSIKAKIVSLEKIAFDLNKSSRYEAHATMEIAISNMYRALVKLYV